MALNYLTLLFIFFLLKTRPELSSANRANDVIGVPFTTVRIYNSEPYNVTVHCKSADDDLGAHELAQNNRNYFEFKFQPKVIITSTQFWCSFVWPFEPRKYFDIYVENRDMEVCKFCPWFVLVTGPCLNLEEGPLCFPWNSD